MSVTSWQFFALLGATLLFLLAVPAGWRKAVLIAASFLFYVNAGIVSTIIVGMLIVANYFFMLGVMRGTTEALRDRIYLGSMLFNIVVFCALKLAFEPAPNVEATSWSVLGYSVGYPLGLSFIILMLHGAVTDAHSGRHIPDGKLSTFALFSGFFPYVSAGPVERLHHMEGPLGLPIRPTLDDFRAGLSLIALGLVKKIAVANRFKLYVDAVFGQSLPNSSPTVWLAVIVNVAYVYCDFSGYTDIARGAARCLGIDVQINFDRPFTSRSVTEFWRRWHMSFSTWLRDYLYMPIAFVFRRYRKSGTSIALLTTFAICGFWHRAAWTFLLFGLLHGAAMAAELKFGASTARPGGQGRGRNLVAHLYTLLFLALTIVLFSARDLGQAGRIFHHLVAGPWKPSVVEFSAYKGVVIFALTLSGFITWQFFEYWHRRLKPWQTPFFLVLAAWAVLFLGEINGGGFVYAQF
jgi:D-alanyl-lipoteichoic acid acyltransferase DltB (MBOAT superfamily)